MPKKSINNSEKINNLALPAENDNTVVVRKRGRPKGSIGTKRPDKTIQTMPGENTKYLSFDITLSHLPPIDINNPAQVKQRIDEYFTLCAERDVKPSVAALALAFHVSRFVLYNMISQRDNTIKNTESLLTLKTAYDMINSYYEHMMNNGKINPVAGIFLMKNNLGYRDETQYTFTTNQENNDSIQNITERAGLLLPE